MSLRLKSLKGNCFTCHMTTLHARTYSAFVFCLHMLLLLNTGKWHIPCKELDRCPLQTPKCRMVRPTKLEMSSIVTLRSSIPMHCPKNILPRQANGFPSLSKIGSRGTLRLPSLPLCPWLPSSYYLPFSTGALYQTGRQYLQYLVSLYR